MSHVHDHQRRAVARHDRAFGLAIALNLAFVLIEAGFGFFAQSVALLADAGHNLSDVLGLVLAWSAAALARKAPTARFTYGLGGTTILAALGNAIGLLVAVGAIAWEALHRLAAPQPVSGGVVIGVALAGVAINSASAALFLRGKDDDLNVRGAFLHMAADAAVSLGVVFAGVLIVWTGATWIDPATSLIIAGLIVIASWALLRDALALSLQSVPGSIRIDSVREFLAGRPGVASIHDLHVWAMSTTETALTAHLVMPAGHPGDEFLQRIASDLAERFSIGHATLQIEQGDAEGRCRLEPDEVV